MASKRATDLGVKITRMVMADFPDLAKSIDEDVDDVLLALGALAGGILAGVAIKSGQAGIDAAFVRFQRCVQTNMDGTLAQTARYFREMSEQRDKGPKGVN